MKRLPSHVRLRIIEKLKVEGNIIGSLYWDTIGWFSKRVVEGRSLKVSDYL